MFLLYCILEAVVSEPTLVLGYLCSADLQELGATGNRMRILGSRVYSGMAVEKRG